ncbi:MULTISPECIES: hypothetical protein [Nitrospirillum]|uniref:Uncharacterized protein n=1 Tax=Nitrospirillum amazonense TaxID=28077 RepID=A0A560F9Z0_9PROT|nr:hypothetical protein [Nitrospirillum amazonense]TWB18429.1 hypothetical protein FBZ89_11074 [Nitrospirillum amazonense]TWB25642.1 hypothetical protein FBZ88_10939 [Nitrospirillum amazonense]TWB66050.1 hypothetical protein FBZ87_11614 [Nitrospirillum amazonense]
MSNAGQEPKGGAERHLGHIALHYRVPEEGPLAARLLMLVGFQVVQDFPMPDGTRFYQLALDGAEAAAGQGIVYLSALPAPDRALMAAVHAALRVGEVDEHPAVAGFRAAQASDPEYGFHVGIVARSLDWVERTMLAARELAANDPAFKGRLNLLANRSRRGTAAVDERLDTSPVFGDTPRYTYGRHAVQAFIETDIFAAGPLGEKLVLELDYVFPGYPENMFTKTEI